MKNLVKYLNESEVTSTTIDGRKFITFSDRPDFFTCYTPEQMFKQGIMGGGYFYHEKLKDKVSARLAKPDLAFLKSMSEDKYRAEVRNKESNKYKADSGMSYEEWKRMGLIKPQDPFGWIDWYCQFYHGRRSYDDDRQIKRHYSYIQRFGSGKNKQGDAAKQGLLHWAWNWEITPSDNMNAEGKEKLEDNS